MISWSYLPRCRVSPPLGLINPVPSYMPHCFLSYCTAFQTYELTYMRNSICIGHSEPHTVPIKLLSPFSIGENFTVSCYIAEMDRWTTKAVLCSRVLKVYWSRQVRTNPGTEHEQNVNMSSFLNNRSPILLYTQMIPVSKVPAQSVSYTSGTATNVGPVGALLHLGALLNAGSLSWPQVLSSHSLKFICTKHL